MSTAARASASPLIGYLDCVGGASGDMLLGALIDAGAEPKILGSLPRRLGFSDVSVKIFEKRINALIGTAVAVDFQQGIERTPRDFEDIRVLLSRAEIAPPVSQSALKVFRRLAEAETGVHGGDLQTVHLHEVGAVDALVDVVGCIELSANLGLHEFRSSPLPIGHGSILSSHGTLPLPAPAVLKLLQGVQVRGVDIEGETVTPTGAALISIMCEKGGFGSLPAMEVQRSGVGAGTSDWGETPNILRLIVGRRGPFSAAPRTPGFDGEESLVQIETSFDDLDPRVLGGLFIHLESAGALEVSVVPALMKKNRPGQILRVLCSDDSLDALLGLIFQETTTLGIRWYRVERAVLSRKMIVANTTWGKVEAKVAIDSSGKEMRCCAEYESALKVARRASVPLLEVMRAVERSWAAASKRNSEIP